MSAALLVLLPTLLACGGSKAPPVAAAATSATTQEPGSGSFPTDSHSQTFVRSLTALDITNFAAVGGNSASVIFSHLSFKKDNTWSAVGYFTADDEHMDCTESGTWTMDPAESDTVATINWIIGKTDCVTRTSGTETRAQITIVGDSIEVASR